MILKKIKYLGLLLCLVFTTIGCDDYLDRYPLEGPSDQSFFANENELILAINGCYNSMFQHPSSDNMPLSLLLDATTDVGWDRNGSPIQAIGKGSHDANNSFILNIWQNAYRGIGRSNFLLENAEKVKDQTSPELYNRVIAEAKFIRAYHYQYLIELFGDVPLVTTTLTLQEAQKPRNSKEEIVNFILNEFEEAANDLPVSYDGTDVGRATKGAAWALKSRTALYNEKWDIAIKAAQNVMDLSYYNLHNNFEELFHYAGQDSREIIFALQYLQALKVHSVSRAHFSRMAEGHSNKIPGQALVDSYECIDGLSIDESPLFDPDMPFENRDPRLGFTVALPHSNFLGYKFETHKDSLITTSYYTNPPSRVPNIEATHAYATFSGYCWRKWSDPEDLNDIGNTAINVIQIRYAEVLLNYAEAKIEAGEIDISVYEAINAVRQRPNVDMPSITEGKSQDELRSIVRKERKYEFANEGLRLYDIRRWKVADQVMNGVFYGRVPRGLLSSAPLIDENSTPNYGNVPNKDEMSVIELRIFDTDRDYLWPIPHIEVITNPQLEQNPGY